MMRQSYMEKTRISFYEKKKKIPMEQKKYMEIFMNLRKWYMIL